MGNSRTLLWEVHLGLGHGIIVIITENHGCEQTSMLNKHDITTDVSLNNAGMNMLWEFH